MHGRTLLRRLRKLLDSFISQDQKIAEMANSVCSRMPTAKHKLVAVKFRLFHGPLLQRINIILGIRNMYTYVFNEHLFWMILTSRKNYITVLNCNIIVDGYRRKYLKRTV